MSIGENKLLEWIQTEMPKSRNALLKNGDDAALLLASPRGILVATDMLLDGTHFLSTETPPELIGRKSVAVNLSDIAAMGGRPESLFISLAMPEGTSLEWVQRVMNGAADIAREFDCGIDGGDTNAWAGPFAINVCVTGSPHWRGVVTRSGAQDGDVVMVSGLTLGHSLSTGRHLTFTPRVREAKWLMDHFPINSMMDTSDGLAEDLPRLARASSKRIVIDAAKITSSQSDEKELKAQLCDGEDFELVFTCAAQVASQIQKEFPWSCGIRVIGRVESGDGVYLTPLQGGSPQKLTYHGYEH